MPFIPTAILSLWILGPFGFALAGGGLYAASEWYRRARQYDPDLGRYLFSPDFGFNEETAFLVAGLSLILWSLAGGLILRSLLGVVQRSVGTGDDVPGNPKGTVQRLRRPDGSEIHVESYGPEEGPPIVLIHGWGANNAEWCYLKRRLGDRFRLIAWDLPGLGRSRRPSNNDYTLENLAGHLDAILDLVDRPAVVLGHSIGGMITLTLCRTHPGALGSKVSGLALVHTTYINPVRTTSMAAIYSAMEKPVIIPLLHLTIWLWPLAWLMSWMSYLNGSAHLSTKRSSFAGGETPGQLEFVARFQPHASPAVLARGMLGMLRYDATAVLGGIGIPTLVVAADLDPICTPEASERIHRGIPESRLSTLSPAKHMGPIEHPDRFAEIVAEFAASCQIPRPR